MTRTKQIFLFECWLLATIVLITFWFFGKPADDVARLARSSKSFAPERLIEGEWTFFCASGNADIDSAATHFVLASRFAQKNSLKYDGPSKYQNDWNGWPVIFVNRNGNYKVYALYFHEFTFSNETELCGKIGSSAIEVAADGSMQIISKR